MLFALFPFLVLFIILFLEFSKKIRNLFVSTKLFRLICAALPKDGESNLISDHTVKAGFVSIKKIRKSHHGVSRERRAEQERRMEKNGVDFLVFFVCWFNVFLIFNFNIFLLSQMTLLKK